MKPAAPVDVDHGDPIVARLAQVMRQVGVGGRLPSERDLAMTLGVSRTALRDRLQYQRVPVTRPCPTFT